VIAVIQCASRKRQGAGHLETLAGRPVTFVADTKAVPASELVLFQRPDDTSDYDSTWRHLLRKYNEDPTKNSLRLLPAWQLYENPTYARLVDRFGVGNVFILSAGCGLIRADFLTPYYDITFSVSAEAYKRRRKTDRYRDFRMLNTVNADVVVFFGGKDYLPLFCSLTGDSPARRIVFYNSGRTPDAPSCELRRFDTSTRTNWHYECANAFLNGSVVL
jgi:hypothetical protein